MRSFYVRAATLCLVAALALSACSSGDPSDPDGISIADTWIYDFAPDLTGRYTLTETSGVVGGSMVYVTPDYTSTPFTVTGTRTGTQVEFDHLGLDGDSEDTYHFELTLSADGDRMNGSRVLSSGFGYEDGIRFARQSTLSRPTAQ
ncbi:MAG TPA: hypothetical protein VK610_05905 [Rhodothermales bacterium]|nr:hypothetical protein [Rhodothermales bacterium]